VKVSPRNPAWAAIFSFFAPGLGQALGGKPARGAMVALPAIVLLFVLLPAYLYANESLLGSSAGLQSLLVIDVLGCGYHVWAVIDAYREIKPAYVQVGTRGLPDRRPTIPLEFATLVCLVVGTIALHTYLGVLDVNSCTMTGRPCVTADQPGVAGGSPSPGTSTDASPSAVTSGSPGIGATPTPLPSGPLAWQAIADRLRVHSGPGTDYPTTIVLREDQIIVGTIVSGGSYEFEGAPHTDWILIAAGQPGAGGYVAAAYYLNVPLPSGYVPPSPSPSPSPSPTPTPAPPTATPTTAAP
jgi:hypothetical protein